VTNEKKDEKISLPVQDSLVTLAEIAEKRVEATKIIIRSAIKLTNPRDWVNLGGIPYLCSSGAEKIARAFGVSWADLHIEEEERRDEKGKFVMFTCRGKFSLGEAVIEAPRVRLKTTEAIFEMNGVKMVEVSTTKAKIAQLEVGEANFENPVLASDETDVALAGTTYEHTHTFTIPDRKLKVER